MSKTLFEVKLERAYSPKIDSTGYLVIPREKRDNFEDGWFNFLLCSKLYDDSLFLESLAIGEDEWLKNKSKEIRMNIGSIFELQRDNIYISTEEFISKTKTYFQNLSKIDSEVNSKYNLLLGNKFLIQEKISEDLHKYNKELDFLESGSFGSLELNDLSTAIYRSTRYLNKIDVYQKLLDERKKEFKNKVMLISFEIIIGIITIVSAILSIIAIS